jgi:hypothetical protein
MPKPSRAFASSRNARLGLCGMVVVVGVFCAGGFRAALQFAAASMALYGMVRYLMDVLRIVGSSTNQKPTKTRKSSSGEWWRHLFMSRFPWAQSFESRLEHHMGKLRYTFEVELDRKGGTPQKIGLQLLKSADALEVQDIMPDSLLAARKAASELPQINAGDRLVTVNSHTSVSMMLEELAKPQLPSFAMRFARKAVAHKHYRSWEVELERSKNEPWGMKLDDIEGFDGARIGRVVAGGVVSLWNRRTTQRGRKELAMYPEDWIIACKPALNAKGIFDTLRTSSRVRLTLLRWKGHAEVAEAEAAPVEVADEEHSSIEKKEFAKNEGGAAAHQSSFDTAKHIEEAPTCTCCGNACDKYVVMCCAAGEVLHFRRECWRKKYGGFTIKHAPETCTCGAPVSNLAVYEWIHSHGERRLVHTIHGLEAKASGARSTPADRHGNNVRKQTPTSRSTRAVERANPVEEDVAEPRNESLKPANAQDDMASEDDFWVPRARREAAPPPEIFPEQAAAAAPILPTASAPSPAANAVPVPSARAEKRAKIKVPSVDGLPDAKEKLRDVVSTPTSLPAASIGDPWAGGADPWSLARAADAAPPAAGADPWAAKCADPWAQAVKCGKSKAHAPPVADADPWAAGCADPWSQALNGDKSVSVSGATREDTPKQALASAAAATVAAAADPWASSQDPWSLALNDTGAAGAVADPWAAGADPWSAVGPPPGLALPAPPGLSIFRPPPGLPSPETVCF